MITVHYPNGDVEKYPEADGWNVHRESGEDAVGGLVGCDITAGGKVVAAVVGFRSIYEPPLAPSAAPTKAAPTKTAAPTRTVTAKTPAKSTPKSPAS